MTTGPRIDSDFVADALGPSTRSKQRLTQPPLHQSGIDRKAASFI
jgi:hypothetical protein